MLYHSGRLFANFAYLQTMKLATVAPDSVWLHQAAGEANESQGLYDAAIREYRQVITAAPRRPGIHFRIGRVLLERSKEDASSAEMAGDAVKRERSSKKSLRWIPQTRMPRTSWRRCVERPESSSRHARSSSRPCRTIQRSSRRSSDSDVRSSRSAGRLKRLPYLQAALKGNPENDVAHYQAAQAYRALGNSAEQEKALAEFNRLRSLAAKRTAVPETKPDVTPQVVDPKSAK